MIYYYMYIFKDKKKENTEESTHQANQGIIIKSRTELYMYQ